IEPGVRIGGVSRHRTLQQVGRGLGVSRLARQHAEEIQRVGVVRLTQQNASIGRLGLDEAPTLVSLDRGLQVRPSKLHENWYPNSLSFTEIATSRVAVPADMRVRNSPLICGSRVLVRIA